MLSFFGVGAVSCSHDDMFGQGWSACASPSSIRQEGLVCCQLDAALNRYAVYWKDESLQPFVYRD